MKFIIVCLSLILLVPTVVRADGWALFSKHEAMKDHLIVDVGEASKVDPPPNTKWVTDVYQLNGRCFTFSGYMGYWGYGGKPSLLLVNQQNGVKLAVIETSIGAIKVDIQSVVLVACPAGTNVIPYSDDPEERLRLLIKREEELKKGSSPNRVGTSYWS